MLATNQDSLKIHRGRVGLYCRCVEENLLLNHQEPSISGFSCRQGYPAWPAPTPDKVAAPPMAPFPEWRPKVPSGSGPSEGVSVR